MSIRSLQVDVSHYEGFQRLPGNQQSRHFVRRVFVEKVEEGGYMRLSGNFNRC